MSAEKTPLKPVKPELLLPFLDEMSKHANWCRKNVSNVASCTCPAEGAAWQAEQIRQHIASIQSESLAPALSASLQIIRDRDAARERVKELEKQVAALSKIDEQGSGHDDAMALIAHHFHEIQVLCDAFGYDPSEWLQDEVANELADDSTLEANLNKPCETCRGKGYTELEGDFQFRTSEHFPKCEDCGGTGSTLNAVRSTT